MENKPWSLVESGEDTFTDIRIPVHRLDGLAKRGGTVGATFVGIEKSISEKVAKKLKVKLKSLDIDKKKLALAVEIL